MQNIQVGEKNEVVGSNGRDTPVLNYHEIQDKSLALPFTAQLNAKGNVSVCVCRNKSVCHGNTSHTYMEACFVSCALGIEIIMRYTMQI